MKTLAIQKLVMKVSTRITVKFMISLLVKYLIISVTVHALSRYTRTVPANNAQQ